MAQDPIYRSRGISIESQGRLNLTNVQEQIRASQRLSGRLDQLSQLALGEIKETAIREGKQYGVQNPPSLPQIADAIQSGENIDELFADPSTDFGKAARATQTEGLYLELMNQFTANSSNMLERMKGGEQLDPDFVQEELNANIEGFAKLLAQVNPDLALKFRASATTMGYETVSKARKQIQEITQQKASDDIAVALESYDNHYSAIIERSSNPVDIEALMTVPDQNLESLINQDPKNATTHRKSLKEIKQNAVKSVISNYILDNNMMKSILDDDFGKYNALINMEEFANPKFKEELQTHILKQYDNKQKILTNAKISENAIQDEQANKLIADNAIGKISDDDLFKQLDTIGYILDSKDKIDIMKDEVPTIDQQDEYYSLEAQVINSQIGPSQIENKRKDGSITIKQAAKLKDTYNKQIGNLKDGYKVIYNEMKINENELAALSRDNPTRALISEAQNELSEARDEFIRREATNPTGEVFNEKAVARQISSNIIKEHIQSVEPGVWKNTQRALKDLPEYRNDKQLFMTASDQDIADAVKNIQRLKGKNTKPTVDRLIRKRNELNSYALGVIPDER